MLNDEIRARVAMVVMLHWILLRSNLKNLKKTSSPSEIRLIRRKSAPLSQLHPGCVCSSRFGHSTTDDDASIIPFVHCCYHLKWWHTRSAAVVILRVPRKQSWYMQEKGVIQKGPRPACTHENVLTTRSNTHIIWSNCSDRQWLWLMGVSDNICVGSPWCLL